MITKSGTNQFHGSLWELHRDASMDAKNYFDLSANPIPPFVRNQFGAGVGGPLKRDHTFFFVNMPSRPSTGSYLSRGKKPTFRRVR